MNDDNVIPFRRKPVEWEGPPYGSTEPTFLVPTTTVNAVWPSLASASQSTGVTARICPDLLDYDALGAADNLRGRVVRAFFWLMKGWKP